MVDSVAVITRRRLTSEEGFRAKAYRDTRGLLTIGYGFCIDRGISEYASAALLQAQLEETINVLSGYSWYRSCDPVRQSVLVDIAFNTGISGLLHFVEMIAAITRSNWLTAKTELLNSKAAQEDPKRYESLSQLLLTGGSDGTQ